MIWNPNPIAFHIFGVPIAWYGLSWSLAIIAGYFAMQYFFKQEKKDENLLVPFIQYVFIGSLLGARLFEMVFYQWQYFSQDPMLFFRFRQGGLASHGAMIGVALAIALFSYRHKALSFTWLIDRSVIVATLQGAIIRVGNFMNSELYGTATNSDSFGVQFVQVDDVLRHPVQLYEAIWLFCCYVGFMFWYKKQKKIKPLQSTAIFFIVVLGGRVVLEFFKALEIAGFIFSKTQWISIVGILVGFMLLWYSKKQKELI